MFFLISINVTNVIDYKILIWLTDSNIASKEKYGELQLP